jgi:hypothetical protein
VKLTIHHDDGITAKAAAPFRLGTDVHRRAHFDVVEVEGSCVCRRDRAEEGWITNDRCGQEMASCDISIGDACQVA